MNRPYVFLAGEFRVTQPLVFRHDEWQHTMVSRPFVMNDDGTFRRDNRPNEKLNGVIIHASIENEKSRRTNFQFLIDNKIRCFPNPQTLLELDDRHVVMKRCIDADLVSHRVVQVEHGQEIDMPFPFVVKTGNDHRGEGKFLVRNAQEMPQWNGIATVEPFFEGISCRVLMVGERIWGVRYDNEASWIKNSAGTELSLWNKIPTNIIEHAKKSRYCLDLKSVE